MKATKINVSEDRKAITIRFELNGDVEIHTIEAELLRVRSPSAEVQGHSPEQRILVSGKQNVGIMKIHPTGNYAIRIEFDDMHSTGIFTWAFLLSLGRNKESAWAEYEDELKSAGQIRES